MSTPARMRTAEGALEIIKTEDPGTAVTLRAIRRMIALGESTTLTWAGKN